MYISDTGYVNAVLNAAFILVFFSENWSSRRTKTPDTNRLGKNIWHYYNICSRLSILAFAIDLPNILHPTTTLIILTIPYMEILALISFWILLISSWQIAKSKTSLNSSVCTSWKHDSININWRNYMFIQSCRLSVLTKRCKQKV